MAADKEIMKAIETLRLDRPGRTYRANEFFTSLSAALAELAQTFREEAELWSKSGARGWKSSEADAYLVAQRIDDVAAQLDNAGGGAALGILADPTGFAKAADALIEAELRESAKRVDAVRDLAGLDALIADSIAERRGHVRDELLPDGHPAAERKTAYDWNNDPRIDPVVVSWSDFGNSAHRLGLAMGPELPITRAEFERARDGGAVTVRHRANCEHLPIGPGTRVEIKGDDVTAYLRGEINDIPGMPPLTPGSVISAPEADNPFAKPEGRASTDGGRIAEIGECCQHMLAPDEDPAPWCDGRQGVDHTGHTGPCRYKAHLRADHPAVPFADQPTPPEFIDPAVVARLAALPDFTATMTINGPADADGVVPVTWESETMTADGHRPPGLAPLLGQPGDAGAGYSHDYIPAGGRKVTYAELLTPVPAASLPPHLSHSQGNTIGDCATKYRLQRVEQLPQVPQWANVGGSAAHACFEAIERMMVDNPALSLDSIDVELVWKHHFEAEIARVSASSPVPVSVWRASRKGAEGRQWWEVNGPLMLRRYLDARPAEPTFLLPEPAPGTDSGAALPAIEYETTIDVPTPYGPLPYKAVLDRVTVGHVADRAEVGALIIRDYKTSYERPTDTTQLGDYAHVLRAVFVRAGGGPVADVPILGTYFDARRGTWTEPVDLLAEHPFEAFQYRVTTAHAQKRALITGPTPARPSSYCGGCSVRYACPIMAAKS